MPGREILQRKIGYQLRGGCYQSFLLNEKIIDKFNVIFLKFDQWIKIVIEDGQTIVDELNDIQNLPPLKILQDEFAYPVKNLEEENALFCKINGQEFIGFKELLWSKNETVSCGVKIYFSKGETLTLYSKWSGDDFHMDLSFDNELPNDLIEK